MTNPANLQLAAELRQQALQLLTRAEALDGLTPHAVTHTHRFGGTNYVAWYHGTDIDEESAVKVLDAKFDVDRDEYLTVSALRLTALCGTQPNRIAQDAHKEAAKQAALAPAMDERAAEAQWTQTCNEQGWNEASQVLHLEGFVRDQGMLPRLAAYAAQVAAEENAEIHTDTPTGG